MGATTALVLSGKGGTAKTLWQVTMAGEASRAAIRTLLVDIDPERNLSNKQGVSAHATGIGSVLEDAGVMSGGEGDIEKGAKRVPAEIRPSKGPWPSVDFLPAGASLAGVSQVTIENTWLLRDIFDAAGIYDQYDLVLLDTGGRAGSLVTAAMYASDVAYAPIVPSTDALVKAIEARERVKRIQRAHPLRWAGVVLSGFATRTTMDDVVRAKVYEKLGDDIRAEVPRRAVVNETYQMWERLGDRTDVPSAGLAAIFRAFLERDLMQRPGHTHPDGVLK